jgi:two-component system CheB/CheR fusion protein
MFNLSAADVGRPIQDLELSYRPVELRSLIERAAAERRTIVLREVPFGGGDGHPAFLDVQVIPLFDGTADVIGIAATYADVSRHRKLQDELERSRHEVEAAYEELQSTSEELETTNEELQSSVEELETTNEELQSTNEELETMNEELQSTNEELQSINDELRERTNELAIANAFNDSILANLKASVIVLDRDLRVRAWNAPSAELWGLRDDEVRGKLLVHLDIGLPVDRLLSPLRAALQGTTADGQHLVVPATNRRGKSIRCKVVLSPLRGPAGDGSGVILMVEDCADSESAQEQT